MVRIRKPLVLGLILYKAAFFLWHFWTSHLFYNGRTIKNKKEIHGSEWTLQDAEYANDATILAETLMAVVTDQACLSSESEKFDLKLKIMAVTVKFWLIQQAVSGIANIELVKNCAYLASQFYNERGRSGANLKNA